MKKQLQILLMVFTAFLLNSNETKAQTVTIVFAGDSGQVYCGAPFTASFIIYGQTTGYAATDSVSVYQNFGDGNDTLFYVLLVQPVFYLMYDHTYQLPGVYNSLYIVTGPDGTADTLFVPNDVIDSSSCGNISGQMYIDANSNCIFDLGETAVPNTPVQLLYNSVVFATTYTASNGYYYFYVPNNNYTLQPGPQIASYGYTVTCPVSGQINVPGVPSLNNNFGLNCSPGFDLNGYVSCQRFRPGFNSYINVTIHNAHCQATSGQAKLILDNPLISYVSSLIPPSAISGDTLIWNFSNLTNQMYMTLGPVYVLTSLSAPLGDTICVTLLIEPVAGDVHPADNIVMGCREISNAVDPNEKDVNPQGNIMSGDWLTYTIFFQNTGTDTAYHVFILDTIEADLDMNTFQPIAASHNYDTYIESGNVVKFDFPNIMLADSNINEPLSHGWVTYRIKSLTGLSNGTSINNTAGIYFDFNAPVITNTTVNIIDDGVGVPQLPVQGASIYIYPNPFADDATLTIESDKAGSENVVMTMVDVTGREVMRKQLQLQQGTSKYRIRTAGLSPGIYFLRIVSGEINQSLKIVRE